MTTDATGKIVPIRLHDIFHHRVPERDWAVPGLIPMGALTVLTGDSGIGKSTLAQQIARAVVLGEPLWGRDVAAGAVALVSYEDDTTEILRRFQRMGSVPPNPPLLILGADEIGHRGPLVRTVAGQYAPEATALHGEIRGLCAGARPRLVIIDPLANAFAGDENDRSQAQPAISLFRSVAPQAAIVLVTHSSAAGLQSGKGGSGSTGWRAAARAQLNLTAGKEAHTLALVKSNYSQTTVLRLRLGDHGFTVADPKPRPWETEGISKATFYRRKASKPA